MHDLPFQNLNRRRFIERAAVALAGISALNMGAGGLTGCNGKGRALTLSSSDTAEPSWKITMISDREPGEPLVVSGIVYGADGRTPLEGVRLYVYHTDARGLYSDEDGQGREPRPRLKGWMRTNAEGRYEFRTIKPASYPGGQIPAHIHSSASGPGYPERWVDSFWFEGDPFISDEERARFAAREAFSPIMRIRRDGNGVLRCVRDIKLERI